MFRFKVAERPSHDAEAGTTQKIITRPQDPSRVMTCTS